MIRADTHHETMGVDEAMMGLSQMVEELIEPFDVLKDEDGELQTSLVGIHIDMPVQIETMTDENGKVAFGITPPIYKLETSFNPVFHQLKFTCEIVE
jgi:hypothetical protein